MDTGYGLGRGEGGVRVRLCPEAEPTRDIDIGLPHIPRIGETIVTDSESEDEKRWVVVEVEYSEFGVFIIAHDPNRIRARRVRGEL